MALLATTRKMKWLAPALMLSSAGPSFQSDAPTTIQRSVEANNAEWNAAFYLSSKEHSMSNSNGVYPLRLRQLRAIAENLCMLADRHRDDHNYVVAYALYTRALSVAQQIHTPENDGNVLVARIRTDQQAAFDRLRIGESGLEKSSLPLA
jgi:hypothetical protein